MSEQRLRRILEQGGERTDKSISSRISRANRAEEALGVDLDYIVTDEHKMY